MLKSYSELHSATKTNLLLGNGFSIGVNNGFSYNSLIEVALKNGFLTDSDKNLFKKFDTVNFETILNHLFIAKEVNEIFSIEDSILAQKYNDVKQALIQSVKDVHPIFDDINSLWSRKIISEFLNYKSIYTTNYDLILYWLMSRNDFKRFTDYFWTDDLSFNQYNTEVWNSNIPIHYLHGALFIYIDDELEIKKISKTENNSLLENVEEHIKSDKIPLFITEGTSKKKMKMIENNSYLNFAFNNFYNAKEGITVYGCSFEDSDAHIFTSLNKSETLRHIAISIYNENKTTENIEDEISHYKSKLYRFLAKERNTLEFFDYKSSPLNYSINIRT